ncbi:hypothetical protein OAB94_02780 [Flavobacteriaceae bacterium]|nr:hypothetical protein [Flavobacteriaceae bacterium]
MFAVVDKKDLDLSLAKYIDSPFVQSFKLVGNPPRYEFVKNGYTVQSRGLHKTLRGKYYPKYKHTRRRRKTQKKGSSKRTGTAVDKAIFKYIANGTKPRQWMAKMLIRFWEVTIEHTLQVTQLPVYIDSLKCATQVDVITKSKDGKLYLWEVKTGFPPGGALKKGVFMKNIPSTIYNHWELQRHFTCIGLLDHIDILLENSRVINVYKEVQKTKQVSRVQARKQPLWTNRLQQK